MKNKIWIIVVSLLVFVVGIWYINKSLKRNDGNNFEGGKPPIYLYYMNLCKKDGGQIEELLFMSIPGQRLRIANFLNTLAFRPPLNMSFPAGTNFGFIQA